MRNTGWRPYLFFIKAKWMLDLKKKSHYPSANHPHFIHTIFCEPKPARHAWLRVNPRITSASVCVLVHACVCACVCSVSAGVVISQSFTVLYTSLRPTTNHKGHTIPVRVRVHTKQQTAPSALSAVCMLSATWDSIMRLHFTLLWMLQGIYFATYSNILMDLLFLYINISNDDQKRI